MLHHRHHHHLFCSKIIVSIYEKPREPFTCNIWLTATLYLGHFHAVNKVETSLYQSLVSVHFILIVYFFVVFS